MLIAFVRVPSPFLGIVISRWRLSSLFLVHDVSSRLPVSSRRLPYRFIFLGPSSSSLARQRSSRRKVYSGAFLVPFGVQGVSVNFFRHFHIARVFARSSQGGSTTSF